MNVEERIAFVRENPDVDYDEVRYIECDLFRWSRDRSRCRACDGLLAGRRKRWCSDACANLWSENHIWTIARVARVTVDDYTCQRCGVRSEPRMSSWTWYVRHGTDTRMNLWRARELFLGPQLDVHHVFPLAHHGNDRSMGCQHHLSVLMTLCNPCHKEEDRRLAIKRMVLVAEERQKMAVGQLEIPEWV